MWVLPEGTRVAIAPADPPTVPGEPTRCLPLGTVVGARSGYKGGNANVGLLGEGVAASTRPDPQAKSLGEVLRSRPVDLPVALLEGGSE
jgi:hypothetical protein